MRAREEGRPERVGDDERVNSAYSLAPAECDE